jgi:hypothetical protein
VETVLGEDPDRGVQHLLLAKLAGQAAARCNGHLARVSAQQ